MSTQPRAPHPAVAAYARHVNPSFVKLLGVFGYGRVFTRALDAYLFDHEGRRYLDFLSSFGASNLGHNHPRLVDRMKRFLDQQAPNLLHVGPSPWEAELAQALAALLPDPLEVCLFASSGSEAVEAAMKLARAATGRPGFAYCRGGFHGTNPGALSLMGDERLRAPFAPLLGDCTPIAFGDLEALEAALARRDVAAFVVEPVQCEGGVVLPPGGYLEACQELCRASGTLLVLDEIQTGLGRVGSMFALEAERVVPDVLCLGKSLGGGMVAVSAAITGREIHQRAYRGMDRFDLHSSTFKGSSLGCVAALETLGILADEDLVRRGRDTGAHLLAGLRARLDGHPLVREVRGRGALVGIELGPTDSGWVNRMAPFLVSAVSQHVFGQWTAYRLLEEGVICQPTSHRWDVLRLEPPLTATAAHVDEVVEAVGRVLDDYQGVAEVLRHAGGRVGSQYWKGWAF